MKTKQVLKRIVCMGLILLALQFAVVGFSPTLAIADGGGTDPPPADTSGISKSAIIDTSGTITADQIAVSSISWYDLVILTAQALL